MKLHRSHGDGAFTREQFAAVGEHVIFEGGMLVFHPENIRIGENVYFGHRTILKGYYQNELKVGDGSWIGQDCFLHAAGGITIGRNVGIGPAVKILTSAHAEDGIGVPILHSRIDFQPVVIEDDADIGVGAIILPGVTVGQGAQVGAGSVVSRDLPAYSVAFGAPARVHRMRGGVSA